jgi:glycosyltransferase involved in cell wall biosynthesis
VVRYHRMERETDYPSSVAMDRVDCMVFVGRHLLDEAAQRFSWPEEKLRVVPNGIDLHALRRSKLPGSAFNLGLIGYVPARKRLDRALDILELLRAHDPRFRLIVKGQPPWAYRWMLRRDEERDYFERLYRRIRLAPLLGEAVTFEAFGQNIPAFLRKVGIILSTSDHEGHQVALAEGMASGCVPVVIDRPGAREQYSDRWVHDSPEEAAASLLELTYGNRLDAEQDGAGRFAERWSMEAIMPLWDEALGLPSSGATEAGAVAAS